MAGLEAAALKLGGSVAQHAAKFWLQRRKAKFERGATLGELAEAELGGPLQRRNLDHLVDRIETLVAEQLSPELSRRFAALPDNEVEAATLAVTDVLRRVDLSDAALLADDADAENLARRVREQFPGRPAEIALAEAAWPLYEFGLDQACRHLVQVVRYLPSFQPAALAELLGRLTQLAERLSAAPVTTLLAQHGVDHDAEFRATYLRFVERSLDSLELLGLPADEQPRLPLTIAYLNLSVSEDAPDDSVEFAFGRSSRLLVRGEAGSGKTTLLHWLAVMAARQGFTAELANWNGLVPFVVRLRAFADGPLPAPEDLAAGPLGGLMPPGWVHRIFHDGKALLLVDGVDEVLATRRRTVRTWLHDLLSAYPAVRVVVTSRPAASDANWLTEDGFTSVSLDPMSTSEVTIFLRRWHEAAEAAGVRTDIAAAHRRLTAQLERQHLRELAANPLLCAMLCALNLSQRSSLPANRMDLYSKALAMLLHLRDAERGITGLLTDAEKRVLLRDLAWRLTLANRVELSRELALDHVTAKLPALPNVTADPEALLAHLLERSGVLREPVPGRVDFVHRTFQEYLAADEAVQQHHVPTLIAHAHLDTWRETVIMAGGHATAKQAGDLVGGLLDHAVTGRRDARRLNLLAAACLETVQDIAPEVNARVEQVIGKLVPPRDTRESSSLATIGPRVLRHLPTDLTGLSEAKAAATVRTAALTGGPDALRLLSGYSQDSRAGVQEELQQGWQYFDPERYAEEVLADAPLRDGWLIVRSSRCLPYVSRLRQLTELSVYTDLPRGLDDLEPLPKMHDLMFFGDPAKPLDLTRIASFPDLRRLRIYRANRFTGTSALAALTKLTELGLGQHAPWGDLDFLRHTGNLTWLGLNDSHDLPDLNALHLLPNLRSLVLTRYSAAVVAATEPLTGLRSLALFDEDLDLRAIPRVFPGLLRLNLRPVRSSDLTPILELPLQTLVLQDADEAAVDSIGEQPGLQLTVLHTPV